MNALTCSAVMDSVEYEYNILMYKWPNIFQNFQFIYKTTLTHTNTQCCVTVAHQAAMFSPLSGGRWGLSAHMTTLPHLSDSSSLTLAHPHPAGSAWREEKSRAREGHRFTELSQGLSDRPGISFTREDRREAAGWVWSSEGTDEEFNNVLIAPWPDDIDLSTPRPERCG